MKRTIFFVIGLIILTTTITSCKNVNTAKVIQDSDNKSDDTKEEYAISIGEQMQLGTYYDVPITWECVDIDENGPLMLSTNILCFKCFDAVGDKRYGSHALAVKGRQLFGSNYWGDSNIRSWLNSDESEGNVNWLCQNPPVFGKYNVRPYDKEKGFLANFTSEEKMLIKKTVQKQLLPVPEVEIGKSTSGSQYYTSIYYDSEPHYRYDDAYGEDIEDSVFLLNIKQYNSIVEKNGKNVILGYPTKECAEKESILGYVTYDENKSYSTWLSTPQSDHNGAGVYYIDENGEIYNNTAPTDCLGIRPAFYLNNDIALQKK